MPKLHKNLDALYRDIAGLYRKGATYNQIRKQLKVTSNTIHKALVDKKVIARPKNVPSLSLTRNEFLERLNSSGNYQRLAKELKLTPSTIRDYVIRFKIKRRYV